MEQPAGILLEDHILQQLLSRALINLKGQGACQAPWLLLLHPALLPSRMRMRATLLLLLQDLIIVLLVRQCQRPV